MTFVVIVLGVLVCSLLWQDNAHRAAIAELRDELDDLRNEVSDRLDGDESGAP